MPVVRPLLLALALPLLLRAQPAASSAAEIDADVWRAIAASVVDGDIAAMARTYHPDAVLVSGAGTQPIAAVLPRWGQDMVRSKAAGARATVAFRFTSRQDDAATAFETGAFRYATIDANGKETAGYVRMEALLVKRERRWVIVMERQMEPITEAAWNAMAR